jgi:hypothetical protein
MTGMAATVRGTNAHSLVSQITRQR